jgi:uncharacterized protein (TIGR03086 family)
MIGAGATTPGRAAGAGLLERAIGYAVSAVHAVTPELLSRPTPCRGWDLRMLLWHVNESLAALLEGIEGGYVGLDANAADGDLAADPAPTFRDRADRLLGAWTDEGRRRVVAIAGYPLAASIMAGAGALEIAVHGWDVAQACGRGRPIPHALATELLRISPLLVSDTGRHPLFAPPVAVAVAASPSDRLTAFLGRSPAP